MKRLLALAAVFLAAPAASQYNSQQSVARPPDRFQGDNATVVVFVSDVSKFCQNAPDGYRIIACMKVTKEGTPVMVLPNPCQFRGELYGHIACHELGHRNSWSGNHEE